MGKITSALKKAAEERLGRIEKITQIKEREQLIIKKIGDSKVDASIISYFDPKALISEQYKILRTNLLSLNKGRPPKVFVVTSSIHSEGKTITSLNLAITLAHSVHKPKVLLVDADMRKGKVIKYLGISKRIGLSEILSGQAEIQDCVFNLQNVDNLAVITSGAVPENPAELLASEKMHYFLAKVKSQFDFVLIDTPPIISVTDSGIVGSQTEGALMVVQAGRTQRGIVRRAEELLHQSHTNILGYILTNIEYHLPEYIYRYL